MKRPLQNKVPDEMEFMKEVDRAVKRKHRGTARGRRFLSIEEREDYNKIVRKKNPLKALKKFNAWRTP